MNTLPEALLREKGGPTIPEVQHGTEKFVEKRAGTPQQFSFSGLTDGADSQKSPENLMVNEESFRMFFDHVKFGIVIQDKDGRIYDVNPAMEAILGFQKQEMKKKFLTEFFRAGDSGEKDTPVLNLAMGPNNYCDIERRLIDKHGRIVWVRLVGCVVKSNDSRSFSILLVDNITDKKESEKTKDAFVDMVAHELKNQLMAVISSLRLAKKEGQFPDVLHELIGIASDGAESLWSILENMLEVSRARAGRLKLTTIESDIYQLIKEVPGTVRNTLIHHITIEVQDRLPPVIVDPARIHLILRNLIDNAIKYSPKGGDIMVAAKQIEGEIVISVKDQGIGIAKADLQNLFQPFERLGAKDTQGSGLGLTVCNMLIKYHNGRIWVESEPGKGSTFFVALPVNP